MKQLLLIASIICLISGAGRAATVSGTLANVNASAAVPNQKVYLMDSVSPGFVAIDSTYTSSSGAYSFTIPASISATRFKVSTQTCSYFWSTFSAYYTGSSLTLNLSIYCTLQVVTDTLKNSASGAHVFGQKVYLLDSTATVYYKDSVLTDYSGVASFTIPATITSGTFKIYTIACGLQSQLVSYSNNSLTAPTMSICAGNTIVSGTVTNITTSAPIAGQLVLFTDSVAASAYYRDSTYTSSSGQYAFILPAYIPSGGTFVAATRACGSRVSSRATYTGGNMTLNLAVCAASTATVSGTVTTVNTHLPVAGQKVYLYDSLGSSFVCLDSALTNASGGYSIIIPAVAATGNIFVYTATTPSAISGSTVSQAAYYMGSSVVVNLAVCLGNTATYSGIIYTNTGAPAAGIPVKITDWSSAAILDTGTTGSTGAFTLHIPCMLAAPATVVLETYSPVTCGWKAHPHSTNNYTGSNIVRSDSLGLCTYTFGGTVSKQGAGVAANAKVYLIVDNLDRTTTPPGHILYAADSTTTDAAGQYIFGTNNAPLNYYSQDYYYRVKAALQSSDPAYSSYLPTYRDTALNWSGADTVTIATWLNPAFNINVSLRGGTNPGGPAFIGGNVLLGANKSTAVGDPLEGRILLLTTAAGVPVAYAYSNAAGSFSFPNLAYGSYKIFGDAGGKTNPPLNVTLSAAQQTVGNIVFTENSTSFRGSVSNVGVGGSAPLAGISVFPNPVKDFIGVSGLAAISGSKTIVLRSITGAVISRQTITQGNAQVAAAALPAGVYLLQVQTESGNASFRIVK